MKHLNVKLIIKALEHYAESLDQSEPGNLWAINQLREQVDLLQERTHAHNMLSAQGGTWLSALRGWIQRKACNGEAVGWGSQDQLALPSLTVGDLERLAAIIATNALNEFKGQP